MSLSSYLSYVTGFRDIFARRLAIPPIRGTYSKLPLIPPTPYSELGHVLVDPNDSLFSICVDYGVRALISRSAKHPPETASDGILSFMQSIRRIDDRVLVHRAAADYYDFLQKLPSSRPLLEMFEVFWRLGFADANFRYPKNNGLSDLPFPSNRSDELLRLFYAIPKRLFQRNTCLLNPSFGLASQAIGGADGDLLVDNCLVEVKCSRSLRNTRNGIIQLLGYWALQQIDARINPWFRQPEIRSVAIFAPRFGELFEWTIDELIPPREQPLLIREVASRLEVRLPRRPSSS